MMKAGTTAGKRRFLKLGTSVSACLALWCAAAPAIAQTAPEEDSDVVIITAQKREQDILDVGISALAVPQEALSEQRIEQIRDLGRAISNFSVKEQIPGAIPVVTIRGVGLDDFSSTNNPAAGIYVDEVALSSLALMSFDLYDLERVEVLRGPQGTLYGRNTTAGAVNIITAKPDDTFEAKLAGTVGNYERFEGEGMLNMPIGENAAFRIAGKAVRQDEGFWESRLLPGETIGEQDIMQGRAQLAFGLGEGWDVNLKVDGLRSRSEMGYGEFFGTVNFGTGVPPNFTCAPVLAGRLDPTQCTDFFGYTDTDGDPFTGDWTRDTQYDIDQLGATARIEGDLGFAMLTSITGYIDFDRDFYIDADASPLRQFEFNQKDHVQQWSEEVRLAGEAGRLNWVVGVFYSKDDVKVRTPGFLDDLFATEVVITADQETNSLGAFAQGEWALTDSLSLVTGIRYTDEEKDYAGGTRDLNPFGASMLINPLCPSATQPCQLSFLDTSIDDQFWSWRGGLNWRVNDDTLLYASVSRGQKSGGFFSGITLATAQLLPYRSEELTAYEVGWKTYLPAYGLRAEAAAFHYEYSDLQTFIRVDLGPISVQALGNVPEAEVQGIDASLDWEPVDGLTLQAGLGLLNTELGSFSTVAGQIAAGNKLPNAADVTGNLRASYEWSLGGDLTMSVQGGGQYSDAVFKDAINDPVIKGDAYWVYDARIAIGEAGGDWELALWGQNLSDEQYVTQGLNSGLGAGNRTYNAPRTFGVTLSKRFQ
ncbi:MAG: TonB-dependent receptor [Hyphomonadaceae bacterium]|nr:TonB-dependent receptor [Hyphomonadaceae bacterium]